MKNRGTLFVVSGPSGVGKGTLVKKLVERDSNIVISISATTRKPREGECDGREYYFISHDDFEKMISEDEILEYTTYCGNYYGTPKKEAERIMGEGKDLILEIEVDGAAQIKKKYPDAVTIMLLPPSITELESRLRGRGTETDEVILSRLARAREEILLAPGYDYVVVNGDGDIEGCARTIMNIITSQRSRTSRMKDVIDNFTLR